MKVERKEENRQIRSLSTDAKGRLYTKANEQKKSPCRAAAKMLAIHTREFPNAKRKVKGTVQREKV